MNLRALRQAAGLTQDQLATRTGLSQAAISFIENGQVPSPQLDTLESLAAGLGCDLATVVTALRLSVTEAA